MIPVLFEQMYARPQILQKLRGRPSWCLALAVLFFVFSLLPRGVMPARAQDGAVVLVICTGAGMVEVAVDPQTLQPVDDTGGHLPPGQNEHCPWAAAHPAVDLNALLIVWYPAGRWLLTALPVGATVLRLSAATGLPPATGPPVRV